MVMHTRWTYSSTICTTYWCNTMPINIGQCYRFEWMLLRCAPSLPILWNNEIPDLSSRCNHYLPSLSTIWISECPLAICTTIIWRPALHYIPGPRRLMITITIGNIDADASLPYSPPIYTTIIDLLCTVIPGPNHHHYHYMNACMPCMPYSLPIFVRMVYLLPCRFFYVPGSVRNCLLDPWSNHHYR
jgi:hypothetical protein